MTTPADDMALWKQRDMSGAYVELDHPADVWLEIRAKTLAGLFENALYAFYSQVAGLDEVRAEQELLLEAHGDSVEDALRALLAEALFHFETQGFLAGGARVNVVWEPGDAAPCTGPRAGVRAGLRATAHLWGEPVDRRRHPLLAEVKAVTYHRLAAARTRAGGWRATVLLDV